MKRGRADNARDCIAIATFPTLRAESSASRAAALAMNSPTLGAGHTQRHDDDEVPEEPRDDTNPRVISTPDEDPLSAVRGIGLAVMIGGALWIGILTIVVLLL